MMAAKTARYTLHR